MGDGAQVRNFTAHRAPPTRLRKPRLTLSFSQSQWFSWIHREDAVGIILESLVNPGIEGPVNVTSPNPVRMAEMCSALGRTLGRPNWLPVPDFAIQALLGEGATVVLQGQKVETSAALKAGYEFKFEKLEDALGDVLR